MPIPIGIDLGTTFSAIAYVNPKTNLPEIIPNNEGRSTTPSVIQFADGETIFGSEAASAFAAGEQNCASVFKRSMGSNETYCTMGGKAYTAEDLSALLLGHLKQQAEEALGEPIGEAVITVPAYFLSPEREATLSAAKAAGINVKKLIDEPNAAAMAYGINHWRENANILVYDLGGGTFDVTLVQMAKGGVLMTIATTGDKTLGGKDWDAHLESLIYEKFIAETGADSTNELKTIVRGLCEGVKQRLSSAVSADVRCTVPGYGRAAVTITREEFDLATSGLLDRTGALCTAVLAEAGVRDVTDVLLVGGSTRMPQVSDYLEKLYGKKPIKHVNPDEAVALGAAIQSTKADDKYVDLSIAMVDGKKVTDRSGLSFNKPVSPSKKIDISVLYGVQTTAHPMGVIAISEDGTRYTNDVIIPSNHHLPVRCAKAFTVATTPGGPNEMDIFVLQGDKENPLECRIPYKYIVQGIRDIPAQRGRTLVRIQYSYDQNGIMHVEARQEQDNINLPIKREPVPADMTMYSRPVAAEDRVTQGSGDLALYSKYAGQNRIPSTSMDKYGNTLEGDLIDDGAMDGLTIYVLNLFGGCNMSLPKAALAKKGAVLIEETTLPDKQTLMSKLSNASQLWILSSGSSCKLTNDAVDVIEEYFNAGHGVYLWGDNDPFYEEANTISRRLFNTYMSGNSHGDKVVSLCEPDKNVGIIQGHLISTGIVNIYEGITIATVHTTKLVQPLIYGSNSEVVTAYYDHQGKRCIIDGGFTRLYHNWDSAGTHRYIVNAAAWLANFERFPPPGFEVSTEKDSGDRVVETWSDGIIAYK